MRVAALGEVTESVNTWDPKKGPATTFDYIDLSAVDNEIKEITQPTLVHSGEAPSRARQLTTAGDVLVSTVRPNLNAVATVPASLNGATASTGFSILRPTDAVHGRYVFHWVQTPLFIDDMVRKATGASYPAVSDRIIKESRIPLPALDEQRRIAAILDHADILRAKRRQVLAHLDALTQSIFRHFLVECSVVSRTLSEVADFFGGASLPAGTEFTDQVGGTLLMRVSDMNKEGNETEIRSTSLWTDQPTSRSSTVPRGAVVLPKRGASIATNKKRLTTRPSALDPNLMGVLPKPGIVTERYLYEWFRAFDLSCITSGSSVPQLNKRDLAPLELPVPPLERQEELLAKLTAVDHQTKRTRHMAADEDALFTSLQSRAFRGEL